MECALRGATFMGFNTIFLLSDISIHAPREGGDSKNSQMIRLSSQKNKRLLQMVS